MNWNIFEKISFLWLWVIVNNYKISGFFLFISEINSNYKIRCQHRFVILYWQINYSEIGWHKKKILKWKSFVVLIIILKNKDHLCNTFLIYSTWFFLNWVSHILIGMSRVCRFDLYVKCNFISDVSNISMQ